MQAGSSTRSRVGIQPHVAGRIRWLIAMTMVFGYILGPVAGTSAQQSGGNAGANYGGGREWSVSWTEPWVDGGDDSVGSLYLNAFGDGELIGQAVFFASLDFPEAAAADLESCIADSVVGLEADPALIEYSILANENGDELSGSEDGYAWLATRDTRTIDGGTTENAQLYVCWDMGEGDVFKVGIYLPNNTGDLDFAYDLVDEVDINRETVTIDFAATEEWFEVEDVEATPDDGAPNVDGVEISGSSDDFSYTWAVEWNASWTETDLSDVPVSLDAYDDDEEVIGQAFLFDSVANATELAADDPTECLANAYVLYEDDDPNIEESSTLTDSDGNEIIGGGDGYAYEGRVNSGTVDGESTESLTIHACWDLGDGQMLWGRVYLPSVDADLDLAYQLLNDVVINGEVVGIDFPGAASD